MGKNVKPDLKTKGLQESARAVSRSKKIENSQVPNTDANEKPVIVAYKTKLGKMLQGKIEDALLHPALANLKGKVDLLLTSPPFPLVRKKRYGNETGEEYLTWLESLAPRLADLLSPTGSLVIEVGNAWEKGVPVMS